MKFLNNEFQKKGAESKGETEEFINSFSLENKCFITADCDIESYTDTKKIHTNNGACGTIDYCTV